MAGIAIGGSVGVLEHAPVFGHRNGHPGDILFDNGYQFQMVLQAPLTLGLVRIAVAAASH